jgi:dihydrofolate reductase
MRVSLIAAVSDNAVIGRDNDLPWRLPRDLKRFRKLTMGHHLLLGRRTFEAIGRPLPGRTMVVLTTRDASLVGDELLARSLEDALEVARSRGETEAFIAGGEQVYRRALPVVERLYLTRVHATVDGDARFPHVDATEWHEIEREHYPVSEENSIPLTFLMLERRTAPDLSRADALDLRRLTKTGVREARRRTHPPASCNEGLA